MTFKSKGGRASLQRTHSPFFIGLLAATIPYFSRKIAVNLKVQPQAKGEVMAADFGIYSSTPDYIK